MIDEGDGFKIRSLVTPKGGKYNAPFISDDIHLFAAIVVMLSGAYAQDNPYRIEEGWAKFPDGRKWGSTSGVDVDRDGNIWVFERCGERQDCGSSRNRGSNCAGSNLAPIFKFDRSGKPVKSFGAGMFVFPHGMHVDKDGNVWVTDAEGKDGKGHQVVKFSPDGKVLLVLGKAGVAGDGPDTFNRPSAVVTAPNGDIFVADGHGGDSNARIVKFSKDGKFIKAVGQERHGHGEFAELHAIALGFQRAGVCRRPRQQPHSDFRPRREIFRRMEAIRPAERDLYRPERHNLCGRFPVGCEAQPRVQTGH